MSKIALVTGGSRGIGSQIAKRLGKDGFYVVVNYSGSEDKAKEVVKEIENNGGQAEIYQCHVQNGTDVKDMIKYITDTHGSIDLVVNNAGVTKDNLLMRDDNLSIFFFKDRRFKSSCHLITFVFHLF